MAFTVTLGFRPREAVIARLLLPVAGIIVLLAVFAIGIAFGKAAGRTIEARKRQGIDPKLHDSALLFIRDVVRGTNLDPAYWSTLSPEMITRGESILTSAEHAVGRRPLGR